MVTRYIKNALSLHYRNTERFIRFCNWEENQVSRFRFAPEWDVIDVNFEANKITRDKWNLIFVSITRRLDRGVIHSKCSLFGNCWIFNCGSTFQQFASIYLIGVAMNANVFARKKVDSFYRQLLDILFSGFEWSCNCED